MTFTEKAFTFYFKLKSPLRQYITLAPGSEPYPNAIGWRYDTRRYRVASSQIKVDSRFINDTAVADVDEVEVLP